MGLDPAGTLPGSIATVEIGTKSDGRRQTQGASRFRYVGKGGEVKGRMPSNLKPGQPAPVSGHYRNDRTRTEVTVTRGEPLPPTPKPGDTYVLVDPTKHRK